MYWIQLIPIVDKNDEAMIKEAKSLQRPDYKSLQEDLSQALTANKDLLHPLKRSLPTENKIHIHPRLPVLESGVGREIVLGRNEMTEVDFNKVSRKACVVKCDGNGKVWLKAYSKRCQLNTVPVLLSTNTDNTKNNTEDTKKFVRVEENGSIVSLYYGFVRYIILRHPIDDKKTLKYVNDFLASSAEQERKNEANKLSSLGKGRHFRQALYDDHEFEYYDEENLSVDSFEITVQHNKEHQTGFSYNQAEKIKLLHNNTCLVCFKLLTKTPASIHPCGHVCHLECLQKLSQEFRSSNKNSNNQLLLKVRGGGSVVNVGNQTGCKNFPCPICQGNVESVTKVHYLASFTDSLQRCFSHHSGGGENAS